MRRGTSSARSAAANPFGHFSAPSCPRHRRNPDSDPRDVNPTGVEYPRRSWCLAWPSLGQATQRWLSLPIAHRNCEREGRALPQLAFDPDPPTVEFHELPTLRQSQPSALGLLLRRPHLAELFKDGSLVL